VVLDDDLYTVTADNSDGTKTACMFGMPVKYKDVDGTTKFIDTSIQETSILKKVTDGYDYINGANEFEVEFSKNPAKGIKVSTENYSLIMSIMNPYSETTAIKKNKANDTEKRVFTEDSFVYENAFGADTSVKYTNTNVGLKEDIILDKNVGLNKFDFEIDTKGDIPILSSDGATITIADKSDPNIVKYSFGKLFADDSFEKTNIDLASQELDSSISTSSDCSSEKTDIDLDSQAHYSSISASSDCSSIQPDSDEFLQTNIANTSAETQKSTQDADFDHHTENVYYELSSLGDSKYKVTVVVSSDYLNNSDIVYPVTIDPSVTL